MFMFNSLVLLVVSLASFLILIMYLVMKKAIPSLEKQSPFECGFSPNWSHPSLFSLSFFMVTLIFLIFDIEIVLLFPCLFTVDKFSSLHLWFYLLIVALLSLGFIWEWTQGMLDWVFH